MSEFLQEYLSWRDMIRKAIYYEVKNPLRIDDYSGIAFIGMGGSGIVGDIIQSMLSSYIEKPIVVVKDFNLPSFVTDKWIVVAISYSGNTLETVSGVYEAMKRKAKIAIVASGGRLIQASKTSGLPHVIVDGGYAPRSAFPLLLVGTIKLLKSLGIEVKTDLDKLISYLPEGKKAMAISDKLVSFIYDGIPFFISSYIYFALALRFKNEFNENSKIPSKAEVFPEWGHNDIVGWEGWRRPMRAIVIREVNDDLTEFVVYYLRNNDVPVFDFTLPYDNYLGNVLYGSLIAGIASVRMGIKRGVNPRETKSIASYKEFLRKRFKQF